VAPIHARIALPTLIAAAVIAAGCIPRHPTRTTRPDVDLGSWEERTVRSESGHEYRYLYLAGPGDDAPVLLLLPGSFYDHRIWLNVHGLAERFEVYALDWPENSLFYSGHVTDYGEIVADFLRAVGIEQLFVAAESMGVFAAVDFASRKRSEFEIEALVLVNGVMFGIDEVEIETRAEMVETALDLPPERLRAVVEWRVGGAEFDEAPGEVQGHDIFWIRPYPYYFQIFTMAANQGLDRQDTRAIDCPVLFLHGTDDELMLIEVARKNPQVFEDATWREFEGLEHSMVFSHGPQMVEAIFEFVDQRELLSRPAAAPALPATSPE
jgi:pimeloyl-ACP methyl ester carboxylesterase